MGSIVDNTFLEVTVVFLLIIWRIFRYLTKNYGFWEKQGVPCKKAVFPYGSLKERCLLKTHLGQAYEEVYKEFPDERFCGVIDLIEPILVIRDPDLIKQILISDFNYFVDRDPFAVNPKEILASRNLFVLEGESWRKMRYKLAPGFSASKMKQMFFLMLKCGDQLGNHLEKSTEKYVSVDVKDLSTKFTTDIIATCALGFEMNSLGDKNMELYEMATSIFRPTFKMFLKHRFATFFPAISTFLNLQRLNVETKTTMFSLVANMVDYRKKNNVTRTDFVDLLIKLIHNKIVFNGIQKDRETEHPSGKTRDEGISLDDMTAQVFVFFAAGLETSSSVMTYSLFELARHPKIQQRLRREVDEVLQRHGGQLTYEALAEMKYMEQVINEITRVYSTVPVLQRKCTQTYKVPGTDLVLNKGQRLFIPVYGLHNDPQYFPEPEKFDPDRFTPENVKTRHAMVHLPFGDGPRNCIGKRFGLIQIKIGLTMYLRRFKVDVCSETPDPLEPSLTSLTIIPRKPVYLKITKRSLC